MRTKGHWLGWGDARPPPCCAKLWIVDAAMRSRERWISTLEDNLCQTAFMADRWAHIHVARREELDGILNVGFSHRIRTRKESKRPRRSGRACRHGRRPTGRKTSSPCAGALSDLGGRRSLFGDVEAEGVSRNRSGLAVDDEGELVTGDHLDLDSRGTVSQARAVVVAGQLRRSLRVAFVGG
jgi:hypothetical protein